MRVLLDGGIDLDDLARQRSDHVGDGLDGLDLGVGLALAHGAAHGRELEEDDLAERVLRVPGDAERRFLGGGVDPRPVVLGVVEQVLRIAGLPHHWAFR